MNTLRNPIRICTALLAIYTLIFPSLALASGSSAPVAKSLSEEQKILHVLNRLGFGARPGDVEKVKKIGIDKYIEQQLNPASIDDAVAENKVKGLEIFSMSTAELFEKYPNPGALLRQLNGGKKAQADAQAKAGDKAGNQQDTAAVTADQQRERRQELNELYRKYDLRPAGQILPQIVANRVLRAVYSERQLQEVMVDFWQNHFNVFSGKNAVRWYIPSYERDVLRKNALGNFKDLLTATAMHPAMLMAYVCGHSSLRVITLRRWLPAWNRSPLRCRKPAWNNSSSKRRSGSYSRCNAITPLPGDLAPHAPDRFYAHLCYNRGTQKYAGLPAYGEYRILPRFRRKQIMRRK